jgi:hypothetical protein
MPNVLTFFCPVCGLEVPLPFLEWFSDEMVSWPIGGGNTYATDETVVCGNGHHYALNFDVAATREA